MTCNQAKLGNLTWNQQVNKFEMIDKWFKQKLQCSVIPSNICKNLYPLKIFTIVNAVNFGSNITKVTENFEVVLLSMDVDYSECRF